MILLKIEPEIKLLPLALAAVLWCGLIPPVHGQQWELKRAHLFVTAKADAPAKEKNKLMQDEDYVAFEPLVRPDENYPAIVVDPHKTFQTIIGLGGAFTDASAYVFAKLPKPSQETILKACFDPTEGPIIPVVRSLARRQISSLRTQILARSL